MRRALILLAVSLAPFAMLARARAQEPPPAPGGAPAPTLTDTASIHLETAPEATASSSATPPTDLNPADEAPPPEPRHKGVVLEQSLGLLGFLGKFKHVAPPGLWLHTQLGYEPLSWLMIFAEGEAGFTDTSVADDPSRERAFPILGFGAGLRFTVHPTDRFAFYLQGSADGLKADVAHNALVILGYPNAESFGASFGGRLGLEWYQVDRHLALGLAAGARYAQGFARSGGDTPLLWDGALSLRYTF